MLFIFGSRLFGKCDIVPGFFHVATRFGHVDYVPLIPLQSCIVLEQKAGIAGGSFRGVPIPLSGKSIVIAWMRCLAIAAMVAGLILAGVLGATGRLQDGLLSLLISAAGVGAFCFTRHRSMTHASYDRACELARILRLNERGMARLAQIYAGAPRGFPVQPVDDGSVSESAAAATTGFAGTAELAAAGRPGDTGEYPGDPRVDEIGAIPMATAVATPATKTFFVTGRDQRNQQDVCITIWARDEADARRLARARAIDVTQVEPGGPV